MVSATMLPLQCNASAQYLFPHGFRYTLQTRGESHCDRACNARAPHTSLFSLSLSSLSRLSLFSLSLPSLSLSLLSLSPRSASDGVYDDAAARAAIEGLPTVK